MRGKFEKTFSSFYLKMLSILVKLYLNKKLGKPKRSVRFGTYGHCNSRPFSRLSRENCFENYQLDDKSTKITGIIGPNGAGKSTFMKSLLELIPATTGKVTFSGQPVNSVRKK